MAKSPYTDMELLLAVIKDCKKKVNEAEKQGEETVFCGERVTFRYVEPYKPFLSGCDSFVSFGSGSARSYYAAGVTKFASECMKEMYDPHLIDVTLFKHTGYPKTVVLPDGYDPGTVVETECIKITIKK